MMITKYSITFHTITKLASENLWILILLLMHMLMTEYVNYGVHMYPKVISEKDLFILHTRASKTLSMFTFLSLKDDAELSTIVAGGHTV
jgi:hypothetical protein